VASPDETRSVAESIVFSSAVLGPVDSIDTASGTMTVLGQLVEVSSTTVFDDTLPGGMTAVSVGDVVEVYALFDASNGHYSATRIERKSQVLAYEVRGEVGNLDTRGKAFNIGNLRISYAGISSHDVPATLNNGRLLRVNTQVSSATPVRATRLQDATTTLAEQEEASIEGLITDYVSPRNFRVDDVMIDAGQAKLSGPGLGVGKRVRIEGTARDGVLVATKAQTKTASDVESEGFELDGRIETIDAGRKILSIRDVSVDYSGPVDFRGGTIANLAVGRNVEIDAMLLPGGTGLRAVRIKFKD
jgi:hypothetical protein